MNTESVVGVIALFSIVLFVNSLGSGPLSGLVVDHLTQKVSMVMRRVFGIIALVSTVAYIIISLNN